MTTRSLNRTERLALIEQMLFRSAFGLRAVELAAVCEVDRRTIYRDLSLLTDIGLPIFQKDGRFFLDRKHYSAKVQLSLDESMALLLAARHASLHTLDPHLLSALGKLAYALPTPIAQHVQQLVQLSPVTSDDYQRMNAVVLLSRAWAESLRVRLVYLRRDGVRTRPREFAPYLIDVSANGVLYAAGMDYAAMRVRALRIDRIARIRLTTTRFTLPTQFDTRRLLARSS